MAVHAAIPWVLLTTACDTTSSQADTGSSMCDLGELEPNDTSDDAVALFDFVRYDDGPPSTMLAPDDEEWAFYDYEDTAFHSVSITWNADMTVEATVYDEDMVEIEQHDSASGSLDFVMGWSCDAGDCTTTRRRTLQLRSLDGCGEYWVGTMGL